MPAAYFRGDTHYQITVKRSGKTDFYVIPSRDRNLTDERHVVGVYARILENFPTSQGYVVALEKYDGEPRKEKVEIPKLAANVCSGQLSRIQKLLAEAVVAWKALEPLIDDHKDQIQKAINIQIKIAKIYYPNDLEKAWSEREKLEQEIKEIVPFQEMLRLYKEYSSCMFSSLRELALLRFYNKEDSEAYLQPMQEFGSIKELLRIKGLNNIDEVDPFMVLNHLNDSSGSLAYLRRSILNQK